MEKLNYTTDKQNMVSTKDGGLPQPPDNHLSTFCGKGAGLGGFFSSRGDFPSVIDPPNLAVKDSHRGMFSGTKGTRSTECRSRT